MERLPRPRPWLPIRGQGHPRDEYGATVAFLLSVDGGYITGAALPVDGGYITGADHGIMRRLRVQERQKEAEKLLKAQTEKPKTADGAKEE